MGRRTLDQLKQKYGTEGIRIIAKHYRDIIDDGDISSLNTLDYDMVIAILEDVGEVLTEEVT